MFEIEGKLTKQEYYRFIIHKNKRMPLWSAVISTFIILFVFGWIEGWDGILFQYYWKFIMILWLIIFVFFIFYLYFLQILVASKQKKLILVGRQYLFEEKGMTVKWERGVQLFLWQEVKSVKKSKKGLLLYFYPGGHFFLPSRFFDKKEQLADLYSFLLSKAGWTGK